MSQTDIVPAEDLTPAMPAPSKAVVEKLYAAIIDGTPPPQVGDPEEVSKRILREIAESDSFDDVFRPQKLPSWSKELLDVPVIVHGFHVNPSTFEENTVYFVVQIEAPNAEGALTPMLVSIGGQKVLMQLAKAWENGWFPLKLKLTEKDTQTAGRTVLGLEPAS